MFLMGMVLLKWVFNKKFEKVLKTVFSSAKHILLFMTKWNLFNSIFCFPLKILILTKQNVIVFWEWNQWIKEKCMDLFSEFRALMTIQSMFRIRFIHVKNYLVWDGVMKKLMQNNYKNDALWLVEHVVMLRFVFNVFVSVPLLHFLLHNPILR